MGLTGPAKAARVMLALSIIGWFGLLLLYRGGPLEPGWAVVLRHAFEGAFVGALCDWFAIWKVYSNAKQQFPVLVRGVSETVIRDMVRVGKLANASELRRKLDDPATIEVVRRYLRTQLPDSGAVHRRVEQLWTHRATPLLISWIERADLRAMLIGKKGETGFLQQPAVRHVVVHCLKAMLESPARTRNVRQLLVKVGADLPVSRLAGLADKRDARRVFRALYDQHWREQTVDWLASVDLRPVLVGGGADGLLADATIRHVVAQGLRDATSDVQRSKRLHDAVVKSVGQNEVKRMLGVSVKAETLLSWFLDPSTLHGYVSRVAELLESHAVDAPSPIRDVCLDYVRGYLDGWHSQPVAVRRKAAQAMLDHALPVWLDGIADEFYDGLSTMSFDRVLEAVVTEDLMESRMRALVSWLAQPSGSVDQARASDGWVLALKDYTGAWLDAWHTLPANVRRSAATQLVELMTPAAIDALTAFGDGARHEVLEHAWTGRLSGVPWVRALLEAVEEVLDNSGDIDARVSALLEEHLGSMGADGFVEILESRTRPSLDWIQFNGALIGGVLGFLAGLISVLVHLLP